MHYVKSWVIARKRETNEPNFLLRQVVIAIRIKIPVRQMCNFISLPNREYQISTST